MATLELFLVACIPRMLGDRLHNTLSVGVDGRMLERQLQVSFAAAALSVLPRHYNVCPDVGKVGAWSQAASNNRTMRRSPVRLRV